MAASKAFYQCLHCGAVHKIEEDKMEISDELYSDVWCPRCRAVTKQLWVGSKPEEVIELCDMGLDSRYYSYNKTK